MKILHSIGFLVVVACALVACGDDSDTVEDDAGTTSGTSGAGSTGSGSTGSAGGDACAQAEDIHRNTCMKSGQFNCNGGQSAQCVVDHPMEYCEFLDDPLVQNAFTNCIQ